jgi:glycosyltransferase involved in cell wall biosynthesis
MSVADIAQARRPNLTAAAPQTEDGIDRLPAALAAESDTPAAVRSLSIVIPVFNEEGNVEEMHRRLTGALESIGLDYEILFIDDGSRDGTWRLIAALAAADRRVLGIRHRRNFGKARALAIGFAQAKGDVVITMDGDLQDDPDEIPRFLEMIDAGYDVVSGWKQRRQDPLGKTAPSKVFNWTVSRVSGVPLHDFNCG